MTLRSLLLSRATSGRYISRYIAWRFGATVRIHRQTTAGYDLVEAPLPALVTVTAGVVEPRYPTFKGIMDAKKKPVDQLTTADLGVDPAVEGETAVTVEEGTVATVEEEMAGMEEEAGTARRE